MYYKMAYVKRYLKIKGITQGELADKMGVDQYDLSKWLNDKRQMPRKYEKNLFEALGKRPMEEIKSIVDNDDSTIDITIVKPYLKIIDMSQKKLANEMEVDQANLSCWLNGKRQMSKRNEKKLFIALGKKPMEEIKSIVDNVADMTIVKQYLKIIDMSQKELATKMEVKKSTISNWLNGKRQMPRKYESKLYEALGKRSMEEIKSIVDNVADMTIVKQYLKIIDMSQKELATKMEVKQSTISNWLNGKKQMPKKYEKKLFEALGKRSMEEIKSIVDNVADITIVKQYLKIIGITQGELATKMEVKPSTISNWLNGKKQMPRKYESKLYEALGKRSMEEIKSIVDNVADMTIVKQYLKIIGITQGELATKMEVKQSTISNWLNGERHMPKKYEKKLFEALGKKSMEEIKSIVDNDDSTIDITIVKQYLKIIGITQGELATKMEVKKSTISDWLNGKKQMPRKYESKLYEALGKKSMEEIRDIAYNNNSTIDITIVKQYLKIIGITQGELATKMGVKKSTISDWLNGKKQMPRKYESKLYEALGKKSMEEIRDIAYNNNSTIDITIVKQYLKIIGITQEELATKMRVSRQVVSDWLNGKKQMPKKYEPKLLKALGIKTMNEISDEISKYETEKMSKIKSIDKKENNESYIDITIVKPYLKVIKMSQKELAKKMRVSRQVVSGWLNGKKQMPKKHEPKLLKALGIKTMNEISDEISKYETKKMSKIKSIDKIEDNEYYIDITIVKPYLKVIGMSQKELAKKMGVRQSTISTWLNGKMQISEKQEPKLLKALGIKSMEEIRNIVDNVSSPIDITIVKPYLKVIEMSQKELATKMGVGLSTISTWLNGKMQIPKNQEPKLLEALGIKSMEEIRDKLDKFIKEYTKIIEDLKEKSTSNKSVDITSIRPYLIKFGISIEDLSFNIKSDNAFISECLNGQKQMPKEKVLILLKVLEENLEKVKQFVYTEYKTSNKSLSPMEEENMRKNLKIKLKRYNISDEVIDAAVIYAKTNHENKNGILMIDLATNYIFKYIVHKAKEDIYYRKIIEDEYDNNVYINSSRYKIPLELLKKYKDDVINNVINKFNDRYSILVNIQKQIESVINKTIILNEIDLNIKENKVIENNENSNLDTKTSDNKISFLRKYLYKNGITISEFSKKTGISIMKLGDYLNQNRSVPKDDLSRILKEFNKNDINELRDMALSNKESENFDEVIVNGIDSKKLFNILQYYDITKEDYNVIIVVFDKKIIDINKIKGLTGVNKSRIYKIFKRCLEVYRVEKILSENYKVNSDNENKYFLSPNKK